MKTALSFLIAATLLAPLGAQAGDDISAKDRARQFLAAVQSGDDSAALAFALPYSHYAAKATRPWDKKRYEAKLHGFIKNMTREFRDAKRAGKSAGFEGASVSDVLIIKSSKMNGPVTVAVVAPTLVVGGERKVGRGDLLFFSSRGQWYLGLK